MKVKITNKNHKIRKSLDRINESNGNRFFDPNIDTIIVDELDLGNGRYGKTDDVTLSESEIQSLNESDLPVKKWSDIEDFRKFAREYENSIKEDAKNDRIVSGKIDPYFKYTDEPGDPSEILNRPDLQVYEPNQRFNHVLKHLPLSVIRKEMFKAWHGIPSALIKEFGPRNPNDDINHPPSELIDHGGYHMSIIGGIGPVSTPSGLDKKTTNALNQFADDFIYTGKIGDIKNNPNIIMVKTIENGGFVYKTINLKPIKAYIGQATKLIAKMAGHLTAILGKLQVFFVTNVPTMATDGFRLFINPAFVHTLYVKGNHEGVLFVLVHELYHNFLLHHTRHLIRLDEFPNHQEANIAQDLEINHLIEETFPILKGQTVKQGGCWDPSTVGKAWEEIYKDREVMAKQKGQHKMADVDDIEIPKSDTENLDGQDSQQGGQDQQGQGQDGQQGQQGGQQGGQSGGQQGGQQGGQDGGQDGQQGDNGSGGDQQGNQLTADDIKRIIEEVKNQQGHEDLLNKLTNSNFALSNFQSYKTTQDYSVSLTDEEIQTLSDIMRNANEVEIADKIDRLLDNSNNGQDGQQGGQGGGQQDDHSHLSKKQQEGMKGRSSEEIQDEIDSLRAEGKDDEADTVERLKRQAESDFDDRKTGGGGQEMSAQDILNEIERLEGAGQQEAADSIRQQLADAYNEQKRQQAQDNGSYNDDEQKMTDMKPSEVDDMLRKQTGNGPAQKQDGYDGSSNHTDHKDVISPEQGDRILKNSAQKHSERTQGVQEKQMDDYKELKDVYDKEMPSAVGTALGNIMSKLQASLTPAVNWKQRLGVFMKTNITPESRNAWNKKSVSRGVYSRRQRDTQNSGESILAIMDVSGSVWHNSSSVNGEIMNPMITQFASELCDMAITCKVKYLYILPFDGDVHFDKMQRLSTANMQSIASNPKRFTLDFEGGGATNFDAAINALHSSKIKRLKANVVILFSDGGDSGTEKTIPHLPRSLNKNAFLWFIVHNTDGSSWNKDFNPPYGQVIKVIPGKGAINESTKYPHRNEIRKQKAQKLFEKRMEENSLYQYVYEGKFMNPSEYSPEDVERIPFNRLEAYDEGKVKTSNSKINDRIKLFRIAKDFNKLSESISERGIKGEHIYNKINESKDVTVDDIQEAIRKSQQLQNE